MVARALARILSVAAPAAAPPPARLDFDPAARPTLVATSAELSPLILIVDDDQHGREGWAEFLRQSSYRVTQASDGEEALQKIEARAPDLVIADLGIPRLDGWALTRAMKASPVLRHIPLVVLTGLDYPDALERATAAGCNAFLSKPCDPLRLLAVVRGLLARSHDIPS